MTTPLTATPRDPNAPTPVHKSQKIPNTEAGPLPGTPTDTPPADPANAAREHLGQMMGLAGLVQSYLAALVDIDRHEVQDVMGGVHKFRTALPARAQLATSLRVERFVQAHTTTDLAAEVREEAETQGWRAGLRRFLSAVLFQAKAQQDIQEIFQGIHPKMLHDARQAAVRAWEDPEDEAHYLRALWEAYEHTEAPTHVLDLFETDALLEALVPFFARFVTRAGRALRRLTGSDQPDETSPTSSHESPSLPSES